MFFLKSSRPFSWRLSEDPYRILIAEFLLQRTNAEQVQPVYDKFLLKFPNIQSLSKARLSSVTKYTRSLGIHWRAKHIINSARYIKNHYNGELPKLKDELLKIPGIGDYVAGAIQAVCYNNAEYVIDSNIARFINRYYGLGLVGEIRRKKIIIEYSRKLFRVKNQRKQLFSILDFTALICKPGKPLCVECNLSPSCKYSGKTD